MKKTMLLAAGRGERLRPLTDVTPKPLLKVGSVSLIEQNLLRLAAAGIEEVVINVSYEAKQIIEALGNGDRFNLKITYSFESGEPLGTGGGVFQALPFLGDEPFILMSSDIWTDYSVEKLSLSDGCLAHLVMVENPDYHPKGDYALLPSGLLDFESQPKYTYANICVIDPELFAGCRPGVFQLAKLFSEAMQRKSVSGELYHGQWFNVGTLEELLRLEKSLA